MASIAEVIEQVDVLKPNQFTDGQKIRWLSECDCMVFNEVIAQHEGAPDDFTGYDLSIDRDTVLLVRPPHDIMYRQYLMAQIDLANQEYTRYNNTSGLFNTMYQDFRAWYTRNHMPVRHTEHFTI